MATEGKLLIPQCTIIGAIGAAADLGATVAAGDSGCGAAAGLFGLELNQPEGMVDHPLEAA